MSTDAQAAPHPAAPRTYKRRGRATPGQERGLEALWPRFGLPVDGRPLDLPALFGRSAPVALEIGFGLGEVPAAMALEQPDVDLLAVDVHRPGLGALLRRLGETGSTNVRVADGDARVLLATMLAPGSLRAVRVFFPDPWPKQRHHKRRLVGPGFLDLVASRLAPGGTLHVATDWAPYAAAVRALLAAHPALEPLDVPPWRPPTRFERYGLADGRPATDLAARRV